MNVISIGNQDNRTNFNGVIFIKGRCDCTLAQRVFDYEIAKKISEITDEMVSRIDIDKHWKKNIILKDGSSVYCDNEGCLKYTTPDNAFFPFKWVEFITHFQDVTYSSFKPAVNRLKEIYQKFSGS